jgi:HSP20 family protein
MALTPYFNDPFFGQIERAMDSVLSRSSLPNMLSVSVPSHPMDIVETKDSFQLTADAPGFTPDEINVHMHEGTLTISGQRKQESEEKDESGKVIRRERFASSFSRSFTLPESINEDGISAKLDKGVLTVTVPKVEPAPKAEPKRITVQ